MTTPTKSEIEEKAFEINAKRNHDVSSITPELEEVKEDGSYEEAKRELMTSESSQYLAYIEQEANSLGYELRKISPSEYAKQVVPDNFEVDIEEALRNGIFISGTSQSGKTNLAMLICDLLMRNNVICYAIDPSQVWKQKSSIPYVLDVAYPSKVTWKDRSTVFDISTLKIIQQKEFVEKFCKTLFTAKVNSDFRPKTFIFFEESHLYFPEGCMKSKMYQEALRIITVGANFNIRFGLVTQWASLVDKTVVKFPKQKYLGYSSEKNDKAYLKTFVGEKIDELESLKLGEFLYDYGTETKKIRTPKFQIEKTEKSNQNT